MTENQEGIIITTDKILFFDMDGTLVDTNLANFSAYKNAVDSVFLYCRQKPIQFTILKSDLTDYPPCPYIPPN